MAENKKRFWFYAGRNARAHALAKVSGVPEAEAYDRADAKKKRITIPSSIVAGSGDWDYVVVAPAEPEPEPEE